MDFDHLADLAAREVFWVTRAKDNLQCRVVRKLQDGSRRQHPARRPDRPDQPAAQKVYPVELRRVTALVEVDGELREMVFLTNNVDLERPDHRRSLSLPLEHRSLLQGTQTNPPTGRLPGPQRQRACAGRSGRPCWPMCCCASAPSLGHWGHSFTRLFALIRSALWQNWELRSLLEVYGTAGGGGRFLGTPQQAYLAGLRLILWDSRRQTTMNS